jgi:hypothetical protein
VDDIAALALTHDDLAVRVVALTTLGRLVRGCESSLPPGVSVVPGL